MNLLTDYLQVRSGGGIILLPNNILGGCPWERWLHRSLRPTLATQDAAKRRNIGLAFLLRVLPQVKAAVSPALAAIHPQTWQQGTLSTVLFSRS